MHAQRQGRSRSWLLLVFGVCLPCITAHAQDTPKRYWSDTWRGWHFYEDPIPPPPPVPPIAPTAPQASQAPLASPAPGSAPPVHRPVPAVTTTAPAVPEVPRLPEIIAFEQLQKALEQARTIAIMRPSEANVRRYLELESRIVQRASDFADMAQHVAWTTPQLDPTLQGRPVGAKALEVFERQQLHERSRTVSGLGQDHVLLFFYRSDCPYCHAFAPILHAFRDRHGIRVLAISIDGGPLPGFADARADNGIATTLQVAQVPAVFLAQPFTGRITPIGFGILSESQLLERITQLTTGPRPGPAETSLPLSASDQVRPQTPRTLP